MDLSKRVSLTTGVLVILASTVVIFGGVFSTAYYADLYAASILDAAGLMGIK